MKTKTDIIWLESVDSTNNEAKRRLDSIDKLSVLSAVSQSAGKGQGDHTWTSSAGKNLTFSIVIKPEGILAKDSFVISQITALSVVDFLAGNGIEAEIKWPNDIYVCGRKDGKKICGILIENVFKGESLASSIIGVGLNINQTDFPDNLPNPVSLKQLTGRDYNLDETLEQFMEVFTEIYEKGSRQEIDSRYNKLMFSI